MKVFARFLLTLGIALGAVRPVDAARGRTDALNQAAGLYHQAQYDSSRARLEGLLGKGSWRHKDSLLIFQYLGMTESRLGKDSAAVVRFQDLLDLDSLFRFPRNEDSAIVRNFKAAREARSARLAEAMASPRPPPQEQTATLVETASPPSAPSPEAPPPDFRTPPPLGPRMTLALGAVPLGGGWLVRKRHSHALALGLLQAGGLLLSIYASEMQTRAESDPFGREGSERNAMIGWQWTQRVSLSTAVGAYLFSIIAAGGD